MDSGGPKEAQVNCIRQVAPMCSHGMAHWHDLANTIKPSVCGGDAALCQITLTTCYDSYYRGGPGLIPVTVTHI